MGKYNTLDLFAGCGGLSKGFERAGFNVVAANDNWEPAAKTHIRNHPNTKFFLGDITQDDVKKDIIDFFKDKPCDVIIGGPPCQAYSLAGLRDPNDPRGKLFEDYVEIVKELQPKIFVMENVKGILTIKHDRDDLTNTEKKEMNNFRDFEKEKAELLLLRKQSKNNSSRFNFGQEQEDRLSYLKEYIKKHRSNVKSMEEYVTDKIQKRFKEIGYTVKFRVLNAADYGVPQRRQRVIFIGRKKGLISHPLPTHSNKGLGGLKPWLTVKEAIGDLENAPENTEFNHIITAHNPEFEERIRKTPIGESVFGNYSDAFFKAPPDEPSRTVKENHGGVFLHYSRDRVMTPRELARLQSFPDDFMFLDSKSNILKQIGNAVPVGLAEAIGQHIMKLLDDPGLETEEGDVLQS